MYLTPVAPTFVTILMELNRLTIVLPYLQPQLYQFEMQMHGHKTLGTTSMSHESDYTTVSTLTGTTSSGMGMSEAGASGQKGKLPV